MMMNLKRIMAFAAAVVSAGTLIAAQTTAAFAADEPAELTKEEIQRQIEEKRAEREAYFEEYGDTYEEPEFNLEELDPEFAKIVTLFGDVNYDKVLGVSDAVQLQRYLLGQTEELGNWFNADLNQDGIINAQDFTLLKQQICGVAQKKGGSAAINLVDMMTGEPIDGGYVSMFCVYDDTWAYDVRRWKNTADSVAYFSGLPTDPKYVYYLDIDMLPNGYGNEFGNPGQQFTFAYAEGETDKAVNLRIASNEAEKNANVAICQMDWAMETNILDYGYDYGWVSIEGRDGSPYYARLDSKECALPDGEYHATLHPYSAIWDNYPMVPLDPASDFAKHVRELHPDVTFTDKSGGIDFTVKDGKADQEIVFDFAPQPGQSNSITVHCVDGMSGEPIEGVQIKLTEAPDTYAKVIAEWTSDKTGTHTFDGLLHTGFDIINRAYKVSLGTVPTGYERSGDADTYVCAGYVNGYEQELTFYFFELDAPKTVSVDVVKYEDGSVINDAATFDVYRLLEDDFRYTEEIHRGVKAGEKFALLDGKYAAYLNGRELKEKGYTGIDLFDQTDVTAQFDETQFYGNTTYIAFTVKNGKPDRDLKFFVTDYEPEKKDA